MSSKIFAGVDEVGRGCLAGPVISCAIILKKSINKKILKDSKTISFKDRLKIAEHLKKKGITVTSDLKGVGKNLQDHLMFRPVYKVKNIKTLNKKINSLTGKFLIGLEYILFRKGPMTMGASQLCGFAKSDETRETPNL